MFANPRTIVTSVFVVLIVAASVWFYFYSQSPLNSSCRKIMADWQGKGIPAADALYDSLSPAARAHTTREGTRMYLDTVCRTETDMEDIAISDLRDKLERNLTAPQQ